MKIHDTHNLLAFNSQGRNYHDKVVCGGYLKESWSYQTSVIVKDPVVVSETISGRVGILNLNRAYGWGV